MFVRILTLLTVLSLAGCSTLTAQSIEYDRTSPEITKWMAQPAILVFSKTKGWRHNQGIAGADLFFVQMSREKEFGIFTTSNGAVFNPEDLARFDVVVFNNMTGDTLSPAQRTAFEQWLSDGGAWIGIHGAGDASQDSWSWYQENVIGPRFIGHPQNPQFQEARVETLNAEHPVTQGISPNWVHNDEWYSFDSRAQDHEAIVLFGLDESTYDPVKRSGGEETDLRMGEGAINHPIVWVRCIGKGRTFYSAIGHSDKSYEDPENRKLLSNAFNWVTKKTDKEGAGCSK
jgi:type 1 glutamine amidotransferase